MDSSRAEVSVLLSKARHDFARASPEDPEGPKNAARALLVVFALLGPSFRAPNRGSATTAGDPNELLWEEKRRIFMDSYYLPFASFLLREVGPRWLPIWFHVSTSVGGSRGSSSVAPAADPPPRSGSEPGAIEAEAREKFDAFFRPPHVPASMALLALLEALGKHPDGRGVLDSRSTTAAPDARTVQQACRLLEPFLDPVAPFSDLRPEQDTDSHDAIVKHSAGAEYTTSDEVPAFGRLPSPGASPTRGPGLRHLFVQAVMELSREEASDSAQPELRSAASAATDAADRLAHVLCLGPYRVSNTLGPVAPPAFAPGAFFAAVCRALVHAVFVCLDPRPSGLRSPGGGAPPEGKSGAGGGGSARGIVRWHGGGSPGRRSRALRATWSSMADQLVIAGRAPDLADAFLTAIEGRGPSGRTPSSSGEWAMIVAGGGGGSDRASAAGGGDGGGSDIDLAAAAAAGGGGGGGAVEALHDAELAGAWEAWAGSDRAGTLAWLVSAVPVSRRKPFLEAVLRALWKPRQRHGHALARRWQSGFAKAACRALIGGMLVAPQREGTGAEDGVGDDAAEVSLGVLEDLLLRRPLPLSAAEAMADTLAWSDRRAADVGGGVRSGGRRRRLLALDTAKRLAAVWSEPAFVNTSPPRQHEFYSRFLLASLRG